MYINPNSAGLLNVAGVQGGTMLLHLLDNPKTFFFDFLKVYNELGKVKKFWTSRPFFHVRAHCAPLHH